MLLEETRLFYSRYCEPSYRRKEAKLTEELWRSVRACDIIRKIQDMNPKATFTSSSAGKTSSFDCTSQMSLSDSGDSFTAEEVSQSCQSSCLDCAWQLQCNFISHFKGPCISNQVCTALVPSWPYINTCLQLKKVSAYIFTN